MPVAPIKKKRTWDLPERKQHQRSVDNSKFYNSRTWRKFRRVRLDEEPLCRKCLANDMEVEAKVLDHIVRIIDGGAPLTKENTQPLCTSCHNSKSGKEAHGYKEKK